MVPNSLCQAMARQMERLLLHSGRIWLFLMAQVVGASNQGLSLTGLQHLATSVSNTPKDSVVSLLILSDPLFLISGQSLPNTTFNYNASCLIRDLNSYVAQTYTNYGLVTQAAHSSNASALESNLNGIIGGSTLGVHSAGHFTVGGLMDSIHVSVQDPVWWMLHANIDRIYTSWQQLNPAVASQLYGTETANNAPPSANVTLDTIEPDWGYFDSSKISVGDLVSTMSGPFCYTYDSLIA